MSTPAFCLELQLMVSDEMRYVKFMHVNISNIPQSLL